MREATVVGKCRSLPTVRLDHALGLDYLSLTVSGRIGRRAGLESHRSLEYSCTQRSYNHALLVS